MGKTAGTHLIQALMPSSLTAGGIIFTLCNLSNTNRIVCSIDPGSSGKLGLTIYTAGSGTPSTAWTAFGPPMVPGDLVWIGVARGSAQIVASVNGSDPVSISATLPSDYDRIRYGVDRDGTTGRSGATISWRRTWPDFDTKVKALTSGPLPQVAALDTRWEKWLYPKF